MPLSFFGGLSIPKGKLDSIRQTNTTPQRQNNDTSIYTNDIKLSQQMTTWLNSCREALFGLSPPGPKNDEHMIFLGEIFQCFDAQNMVNSRGEEQIRTVVYPRTRDDTWCCKSCDFNVDFRPVATAILDGAARRGQKIGESNLKRKVLLSRRISCHTSFILLFIICDFVILMKWWVATCGSWCRKLSRCQLFFRKPGEPVSGLDRWPCWSHHKWVLLLWSNK